MKILNKKDADIFFEFKSAEITKILVLKIKLDQKIDNILILREILQELKKIAS